MKVSEIVNKISDIRKKIDEMNDCLKNGNPMFFGDRKMSVFEMVQAKCKLESELKELEDLDLVVS